MWISKKKWQSLEKRVADLEREVRGQPEKVMIAIQNQLRNQIAKSYLPRHRGAESQYDGQV